MRPPACTFPVGGARTRACLLLLHFASDAPAELGPAWLTLRYPLTDPCPFDILQSGPGWRGSNAIRSIEATQVHHADRRRALFISLCKCCGARRILRSGSR